MGDVTAIEWTDRTWNPWEGCQKVSAACDFCYAWVRNKRFHGGQHWGAGAERRLSSEANWKKPFKWNRESALSGIRLKTFCASLADIFDKAVPAEWRERAYATIDACGNLDWQLVTKRIGNVDKMVPAAWRERWPENIWLIITVATQEEADRDIPKLIELKKRFGIEIIGLSIEPLLERVDISAYLPFLDWVIVGGESGDERADVERSIQPLHPDWVRLLRDMCVAAGVAFFFKQWGEWIAGEIVEDETFDGGARVTLERHGSTAISRARVLSPGVAAIRVGKGKAGAEIDGREWKEFPTARAA